MQKLNTTAVYILSVVGILCCCVYGLGTIAAIIALVIASKELKKYNESPELYTNGPAMKTAKTIAVVSLVVSLIGLALTIYAAMNQCEVYQWWYDWALENGSPEESLEDLRIQMEEAGCM
jgi:hypothetical protein